MAGPRAVRAQTVNLQIVLPTASSMPRSIAQWEANPAVVQIRMSNTSNADLQGLRFSFAVRDIRRDVAYSRSGQEPVFALGRLETRSFLLQDVVRFSAVEYARDLASTIARDGIPEGAYTICAQVINAAGTSLTGGMRCFPLRVNDPDPPTLIRPAANEQIVPGQLRFQWTPVRMQPVSYRLVVKPMFQGQSSVDAMAANPTLFSEEIPQSFYQYLPSDPDLSLYPNAIGFAWSVQSLSDGRPAGRNSGFSQISQFRLPVVIADTTATGSAAPIELPACGVGAASPRAPRTQQPGSFSPASLAGKKLRVGFFMLEVIDASGSPASLSGTGRIEVPFLQKTVPVRFDGLSVNAGLEVYAGTVRGTEDESARMDIEWMNSVAILSGIKFGSDNATIDASLEYNVALLNQTVGFAGRDLRITPAGVQTGSGRIGLASDLTAPFGEGALRIRGVSSSSEGSYVQWGCAGFERAQLVVEQDFPRASFIPVDASGRDRGGNAILRFTISMSAGQAGVLPTGTTERMALSFAPGFILEASQAVLDLSSATNPTGMAFPTNFQGVGGEAWTGVFIENFTLSLPEALRSFGRSEALKVTGKNIIIDRSGLTVDASLRNILAYPNGDLGGWGFSIDELRLSVVSSSLTQGSLVGRILLPIADNAVEYTATISVPDAESAAQRASAARTGSRVDAGLRYDFAIKPVANLDATLWGKAKLTLESTSRITVSIEKVNDRWQAQPAMTLNGSIGITDKVDLAGVRFENFRIQSRAPYVQKGTWALASPQHSLGTPNDTRTVAVANEPGAAAAAPARVAGMALTLTNVEVIGRMEGQAIVAGLRFEAGIVLPGAKALFAARSTIQVLGRMARTSNGPMRPRFDGIRVEDICLSGGVPKVVELRRGACLAFFENDATFGTGVSGSIGVGILKAVEMTSAVRFGRVRSIEYFYVDGSVVLRSGVPFPGVSAVGIYGFNGGVYYHMTKATAGTRVTYTPSAQVALGVKAGVTVGTYPRPEPMNGDVTLEGAFTSSGGLDYVSLRGNGFMMTPVVNRPASPPVKMLMDLTFSFRDNTLNGSFRVDVNRSGVMTGGGSARLFASQSRFLLHVGVGGSNNAPVITNASKIYMTYGGGLLTGRGYFATGTAGTLPAFPPLPAGAAGPSGSARSTATSRATNGGVMLGASIALNFSADVGFAGVTVNGEAGFDFALQNVGNRDCAGQRVGMDDWYANGQLYAWIEAAGWVGVSQSVTEWINAGVEWVTDVGCEIASWFGGCDKKAVQKFRQVVRVRQIRYDVMRARAAASFQMGMPKPTWYAGTVTVRYNALGVVSGDTRIDFTKGTRCSV